MLIVSLICQLRLRRCPVPAQEKLEHLPPHQRRQCEEGARRPVAVLPQPQPVCNQHGGEDSGAHPGVEEIVPRWGPCCHRGLDKLERRLARRRGAWPEGVCRT